MDIRMPFIAGYFCLNFRYQRKPLFIITRQEIAIQSAEIEIDKSNHPRISIHLIFRLFQKTCKLIQVMSKFFFISLHIQKTTQVIQASHIEVWIFVPHLILYLKKINPLTSKLCSGRNIQQYII